MEFGTWYQLNCETEKEWHDDFALIRDSGFDFVVLWNMKPSQKGKWGGDVRRIVHQAEKTLRALTEIEKVGLAAYLGIWHPYYMGDTPPAYRLTWADGGTINGPDIFNRQWLQEEWEPYMRTVAELYASHDAYRGAYLDDTFPALPENATSYVGYADPDKERFREWLKGRYLSIENLNMEHKLKKGYRSFAAVSPPHNPEEGLALWTDWMAARSDWCEGFAAIASEAYRSVDANPEHHLTLSDQDYHMQCNSLQYGVDYKRLMRRFDRFEIYMAANHSSVSKSALLANTKHNVELGREIAGDKPFQFHTWFASPVDFTPMSPELLEAVVECAAETGADVIEIYTFKAHDWRIPRSEERPIDELPPFREVSLKYNPEILHRVRTMIGQLK